MSDAQPAAQSDAQLAAQPDALLAAQPVQPISPVLRSSVRVPHKPSYLQSYHCNQAIGSFALTDPLPTKTGIARGGARNFCLGGPICVANLLVYTNFYIHTQTHVSIHTHKKLISFIMNP